MDFCNELESDDNLRFLSIAESEKNKSPDVARLCAEIRKNLDGCDLIVCLFIAALHSYRANRCLRPFPTLYVNEDGKNFNALRQTCYSIQPLTCIINEPNKTKGDVLNLLKWLFLSKTNPVLKRADIRSVPLPAKLPNAFLPHYVFEVCHQNKLDEIWEKRRNGRNTVFAYHGSAIDNFYSILKVGLQQHFSYEKEVLFGNGIYLSSDIALSAHYSPFGITWNNSLLGKKHSVIGVCEIIINNDKVKFNDTKNVNKISDVPEKYFVVTDSDMVRVKYLMVYKKSPGPSFTSYLKKNSFWLPIIYCFIIVIVAFCSNSLYLRLIKIFV